MLGSHWYLLELRCFVLDPRLQPLFGDAGLVVLDVLVEQGLLAAPLDVTIVRLEAEAPLAVRAGFVLLGQAALQDRSRCRCTRCCGLVGVGSSATPAGGRHCGERLWSGHWVVVAACPAVVLPLRGRRFACAELPNGVCLEWRLRSFF